MVRKLAKVSVTGVVQGVGFRPFVYRTALEHRLRGWVKNTSGSVDMEVEGDAHDVQGFLSDLKDRLPPLASINRFEVAFDSPRGFHGFEIKESEERPGQCQLVPPDIATCDDCRAEVFLEENRRYSYPFTNCTNCGPRFTIIDDLPYDRPKTTMRAFPMCPDCEEEYGNPLDRRFHAQPNACHVCGPRLSLVDKAGVNVACDDVVCKAAELLLAGKIVAPKGLGGFHLAVDARNEAAVGELRSRKRRPCKPFAVMMGSLDEVREHCEVSADEESLMGSPGCPIVLLRRRDAASPVAPSVAPGLAYLGVMLPYTPFHHLLMAAVGRPLVMTSANLSEEPIATDNTEALARLGAGVADFFVTHDREILTRCDDSVFAVEGLPRPLRRARGYAPDPIPLPFEAPQIFACGAEEKNTFCMTRGNEAFVSQHIGDMENQETLLHFETTVDLFKRLFRLAPAVVAHDLHPDYLSTKFGLALVQREGLGAMGIQHHHAHIAACMAEHGRRDRVIGVALDGTGYGDDGTIWGGEFLVADLAQYERVAHFEPVPLPGGAAAIRRPFRMAYSYLHTVLGADVDLRGLELTREHAGELAIVRTQLERKLNCPMTSSAGRLFDAVAALAGIRQVACYEAQAAIELEMASGMAGDQGAVGQYEFGVDGGKPMIVRLEGILRGVLEDVRRGKGGAAIGLRFHHTVAAIICEVCDRVAGTTGLRTVALSGGVFQNRLLFRLVVPMLESRGFEVLTHRLVPCNDGGVSYGQAAVAAARLRG